MNKFEKFKVKEKVQVWQVQLGEAEIWKTGKIVAKCGDNKFVMLHKEYDSPDKNGDKEVIVPIHLVEKLKAEPK